MSHPSNDELRGIELATVAQRMLPQGCNSLGNTNRLPDARLVGLCPDLLQGLPVLICGAGPSLDADVDSLRTLAARSVVVAVSTAAPSLVAKGIRVDAIVAMESMDTSRPIAEMGSAFSSAWLDIAAHPNTWKACEERPVLAYHGPSPEVWMVTWGLSAPPIIHGGSVTTAACASALLMGCRDITLVGCNFAFEADGRVYADGSGWGDERVKLEEELDDDGQQWINWEHRAEWKDDLVEEGSGVRPLSRRTVKALRGWGDAVVYSTMDYVTQLIWFEKCRQHYPHARLVNCSVGGAHIQGFQHMTPAQRVAKLGDAKPVPPAEVYMARLEAQRKVGHRGEVVRGYAESAARSAETIAEAILMGHPPKGLPWLHDTGVVKSFTVEREIALMMAHQQGHPIEPAQSVAIRRQDAINGAALVREAMAPEGAGDE